jgi:hypothetical protein
MKLQYRVTSDARGPDSCDAHPFFRMRGNNYAD